MLLGHRLILKIKFGCCIPYKSGLKKGFSENVKTVLTLSSALTLS